MLFSEVIAVYCENHMYQNAKFLTLNRVKYYYFKLWYLRPSLWSSGQSFWLEIQRSRVRLPALPDFLRSSGSGTGSTQLREDN
jgi:hypothetical protein